MKLALFGPVVSEKMMFENNGHIQVCSLGAVADNPTGSILFIHIIIQSIKSLAANCSHKMTL